MGRFRKIDLSSFTDDVYGFPANSSARYLQRKLRERESPSATGKIQLLKDFRKRAGIFWLRFMK